MPYHPCRTHYRWRRDGIMLAACCTNKIISIQTFRLIIPMSLSTIQFSSIPSPKYCLRTFVIACMFVSFLTVVNAEAHRLKSDIICADGWHARTIAWKTKLRSANGIAFDNNDRLYVASVLETYISHHTNIVSRLM